ncbi:MAG: hypothetical protein KKH94_12925 [Candidatus Omnitrophica bacterium]|nr:hypothetical protein [Candidatus Omnitrophota bacterium]
MNINTLLHYSRYNLEAARQRVWYQYSGNRNVAEETASNTDPKSSSFLHALNTANSEYQDTVLISPEARSYYDAYSMTAGDGGEDTDNASLSSGVEVQDEGVPYVREDMTVEMPSDPQIDKSKEPVADDGYNADSMPLDIFSDPIAEAEQGSGTGGECIGTRTEGALFIAEHNAGNIGMSVNAFIAATCRQDNPYVQAEPQPVIVQYVA